MSELLAEVKTIRQAIAADTPALATLRKQYDSRLIEAYLKLWLIDLNELINATRPLTELQIDEAARLILNEYYALTIADINLIFKQAKLGQYGDLYGTMSIDKILRWFGDYFNDRCEVAAQMSLAEHDKVKYQTERSSDRRNSVDAGYEEFKKKFNIKKLKEKK